MEFKTVHTDDRGSINTLTGGFSDLEEVTVFETNKGYARGGCIHPNSTEHVCVMEGVVDFFLGENCFSLVPGDSLIIPKGTPHYFISLKKSVVAEWGAPAEEKSIKHPETREIVNQVNESLKKG